jgi:hypothetical protein
MKRLAKLAASIGSTSPTINSHKKSQKIRMIESELNKSPRELTSQEGRLAPTSATSIFSRLLLLLSDAPELSRKIDA